MKKNLNDIILIPTDFSEVCDNALEHGIILAKNMKYRVFLLHVINKDTQKFLEDEKLTRDTLVERMEKTVNKYSKEYDVQVEYLIKSGNFLKKVEKVAEKLSVKLIILGTHGKVGFQKITGSYALKLITATNVPTIVVQKRAFSEGYKNIVFPVTAYTQDRQKVVWAVNIAKTFNSTIHLFPKFESEKYYKGKIMSITKQIKTLFDKYDVKYVDKVSSPAAGNFAKQVIDYAVENESELIMTLIDQDKMLPIFSSIDEQIIFNSSQIPVICINPVNTKKTSWH
jgi:nucleotide-binding universal stress UspA family protein